MNRMTNQDASNRMDHTTGNAAAEEAFGRQANKGILADKVAEELNVPRRTAARVLDAVLDAVSDLLRHRGKVAVKGFGTFERRIRKGRAYKHPLTGESIDVANKETIIFKPSDQLIVETRSNAATRQKKAPGLPTDDILFQG
jgi:nucleoid DNA-binding protein